MLTLSELKGFLRIEEESTEENLFLSSLLITSKLYLINATHPHVDVTNELFKAGQLFLGAHWFENRSTTVVGQSTTQLDHTLDSIIGQLKYTTLEPSEPIPLGSTVQELLDEKQPLVIQSNSEPSEKHEGLLWIDTLNKAFKRWNGTSFEHLTGESGVSYDDTELRNEVNQKIDNPSVKSEGMVLTYNETSGLWEGRTPSGSTVAYDDTEIRNLIATKFDKSGGDINGDGIYFIGKSGFDVMATTTDGSQVGIYFGQDVIDLWTETKNIRISESDGYQLFEGGLPKTIATVDDIPEVPTFTNKTQLDKIGEDGSGKLTYNGSAVGGSSEKALFVATLTNTNANETGFTPAGLERVGFINAPIKDTEASYVSATKTWQCKKNGIYEITYQFAVSIAQDGAAHVKILINKADGTQRWVSAYMVGYDQTNGNDTEDKFSKLTVKAFAPIELQNGDKLASLWVKNANASDTPSRYLKFESIMIKEM